MSAVTPWLHAFVFAQVLSGLGSSFSIPFPPLFSSVTSGVGNVFQIELPSLVPVGCVIPGADNYYNTLVFQTGWPLILYAFFFLAAKCLSKCKRNAQAQMLIDMNFFFMFLLYPGIATKVFEIFNCQDSDDGSAYLRVDLSLRCSSSEGVDPEYAVYSAYALAMIGVHIIGCA